MFVITFLPAHNNKKQSVDLKPTFKKPDQPIFSKNKIDRLFQI